MTIWRTLAATLALVASSFLALGFAQPATSEAAVSGIASSVAPVSENATPTPSPTGANSSLNGSQNGPKVHLVKVGASGFHFEPAQLTNVSVDDIVMFEFYPPDHSVARAEYESACVPYEYTGKGKMGFWSKTQWVNTVGDVGHFPG